VAVLVTAFKPVGALGGYRILRSIGQGGMGAVYEASAPTGEHVALKVLHPHFAADSALLSRFLNEGRAAAAIDHPGIVRVFASGQEGGTCYIAMELLSGESLSARLRRGGGRLASVAEAVAVIAQAAEALAAAHEKRIFHRDLKPSNLMLVPGPRGEQVKIIDFGIAKVPAETQSGPELRTRTGSMLGTPIYMSPEQCRGVPVTDRTDVYSLGVLLFQLLSGRPPFVSPADGDVLAMHILIPPPRLSQHMPEAPEALARLLDRMLDKQPAERPSMAEVAASLRGLLADPLALLSQAPARPLYEEPTCLSAPTPDSARAQAGERQTLLSAAVRRVARQTLLSATGVLFAVMIVLLAVGGAVAVRARSRAGAASAGPGAGGPEIAAPRPRAEAVPPPASAAPASPGGSELEGAEPASARPSRRKGTRAGHGERRHGRGVKERGAGDVVVDFKKL
jgi:serine/threonine-protein kinase